MSLVFDDAGMIQSDSLPTIPGGWATRGIDIGGRQLQMTVPASPDAFVDDPAVLDESERRDYMPYWAYVWPASIQTARLVASAEWTAGSRTLEIGCGVGLVGIAGLLAGLDVTFSDYDDTAVQVARGNAWQNALGRSPDAVSDLQLDWRDLAGISQQPVSVMLGCDVLYEPATHEPVLDVLDRLLADEGLCWLGDPGRQYLPDFCALAAERGYRIKVQNEASQAASVDRVGEFRLLIIERGDAQGTRPQ